jgi:hypothetical protein
MNSYKILVLLMLIPIIGKSQSIDSTSLFNKLAKKEGYVFVYCSETMPDEHGNHLGLEYNFYSDTIPSDIFSKDYLNFFKTNSPTILIAANSNFPWESGEYHSFVGNDTNDRIFIDSAIWGGDIIGKMVNDSNIISRNFTKSYNRKIIVFKASIHLFESQKKEPFYLKDLYVDCSYGFDPDFYLKRCFYFYLPKFDTFKLLFVAEFED